MVGITTPTVWRWENEGAVPGGDTLARVAALYRKSPEWLLYGSVGAAVVADEDPPYEAWQQFLASKAPELTLMKDWMREELRRLRFPEGFVPTVETYRMAVLSYVTVKEKGQ